MTAAAPLRSARPDPWVAGAEAVRLAVLTTPGVVALAESAAFQTHGPGAAVYGVALRSRGPGPVVLAVGVVIEAGVTLDPDCLGGVVRSVRTAAEAAWARTGLRAAPGRVAPVEVAVHVVDVGWSV